MTTSRIAKVATVQATAATYKVKVLSVQNQTTSPQPLAGKTIALPESRELEKLAAMLEAEGARTLRCPLISIVDAADPTPLLLWLDQLARGQFTDVIFLTGEGVRRLWTVAAKHRIDARVREGLARVRTIVRGPKPARALHELGLVPDLSPSPPTSAGIIAQLERTPSELRHRSFGLQLFGDDPASALVSFLASHGARVSSVSPYSYAPAANDDRVLELIDAICHLRVHAVAFTSAPQVERLWQVAKRHGRLEALTGGLPKLVTAAVGPVVAAALEAKGHTPHVVPPPQFYMRRLTEALVTVLGHQPSPKA